MAMGSWHKTGCVLCAQNCGLEILVENGRLSKVRPDKDNPRSRGYACRKGLKVIYHQYPADRLTTPLKREGGEFRPISWEQAISEIAGQLKGLLDHYGPRCLAYMGGGAPGGNMEAGFGVRLLRALGSQYYYSSSGQEFSGHWWVHGRMLGRQYNVTKPDEERGKMLLAWGWNGMMSHQMPRARVVLKEFAKDPDRLLVAVDPRRSETAAAANIHLALRPGSDALLLKAMIALILENGWEDADYLARRVEGWDQVRPWFEGFDARAALEVCGLEYQQVLELCRLLGSKRWCVHPDLGLYMGRKSTLNSYLLMLLLTVCGSLCRSGGNLVPGTIMPLGFHADERDPKVWRTVASGLPPAAAGSFPPAAMPEEITSGLPDRLRAVLVSASNPLRAYPDTSAYERAFGELDLLVVNDIVMSETARLAHYVLPCRSFFESWDGTFFANTYPEVYFQMRRPLVEPPEQCKEASQIHCLLAKELGLVPPVPGELKEAAKGERLAFGMKLMQWAQGQPAAKAMLPFVLAETLGAQWDSAALAGLWGMLMTAPKAFAEGAARAGFAPGPDLGDRVFSAVMDHPEGLWIGKADPARAWQVLRTASGKLEAFIPELAEEAAALSPEAEAKDLTPDPAFPLVLNAGRHMDYNANTMMRNPEWNQGKRACTVALSPDDAEAMGLSDGQTVRVSTAAGSGEGELQVSQAIRPGMVLIPHGFGLIHGGQVYGLNVNYLTSAANRDPLGTPLHRYVPCRVEAA
ncbi:MAG: molybdopterin-dependent oxidoreductase [Desulfarculaceae bacterium]|nr:molybdopterin-dependent oxidoreductase [Desulfarculaceae bacterium]MCF8074256.1 molybdopterin-dependent oxidoreductase [Desulfarculaceae bacterium]MCF8102985.1 molybdopterin-dependent oxidoreductase [Desulfarculaceae bacterium]MCF8117116.1 molybdopterin-dependent oxidoreductase [Desulfarculaceae bacterium]